jgi:hypothetical protein
MVFNNIAANVTDIKLYNCYRYNIFNPNKLKQNLTLPGVNPTTVFY